MRREGGPRNKWRAEERRKVDEREEQIERGRMRSGKGLRNKWRAEEKRRGGGKGGTDGVGGRDCAEKGRKSDGSNKRKVEERREQV